LIYSNVLVVADDHDSDDSFVLFVV